MGSPARPLKPLGEPKFLGGGAAESQTDPNSWYKILPRVNGHGLSASLPHGTADHLMRTQLRIALVALFCLGTIPAFADALVIVQVRTAGGAPADGTVEITPVDGGATHRCQTQNGDCRLQAVPGGRYRVQFQAAGGGESSARVAMIPPDGRVTLHVAAP